MSATVSTAAKLGGDKRWCTVSSMTEPLRLTIVYEDYSRVGYAARWCSRRIPAAADAPRASASSAVLATALDGWQQLSRQSWLTVKVDVAITSSLPDPVTVRKYVPSGQPFRLTWNSVKSCSIVLPPGLVDGPKAKS